MIEVSLSIPETTDNTRQVLLDFFSGNHIEDFSLLKTVGTELSFETTGLADGTFQLKCRGCTSGIEFALILQHIVLFHGFTTAITFFEFDKEHCQTVRYIVTQQQILSLPVAGFESCYETSNEEIKLLLCREFVTAYENLQRFKGNEDQVLQDILTYLQKRHGVDSLKKLLEKQAA